MATSARDVTSKPLKSISEKISFFWLDADDQEYLNFKNLYSELLGISARSWSRYNTKKDCQEALKIVRLPHKVILISSGSLATEIIQDIHDLDQLHSIYIFCHNLSKYIPLKETYPKLLGVFSDSNLLYQRMRMDLEIVQNGEAGNF